MEKKFLSYEKELSLKFKDHNLFRQAFVHRSYLNEHPSFELSQNERLEFLGDAVLELVVTEHLYKNFPNPEGELTNWRAALVNAKILAGIAKNLGMENYLYLSHGEQKDTGKARQYILANTIEAVIGAIYLDSGWEKSKEFIDNNILVHLEEILEKKLYLDPKSSLQEKSQEIIGVTPTYKVLQETGPDHAKTFEIAVFLGEKQAGVGKGMSKQEAQEEAAKDALEKQGW